MTLLRALYLPRGASRASANFTDGYAMVEGARLVRVGVRVRVLVAAVHRHGIL